MTQAVAIVSKNLHKILQITKKLVSKLVLKFPWIRHLNHRMTSTKNLSLLHNNSEDQNRLL